MCGRFLDLNPTESPQTNAAVRAGRSVGFSFPKSYRFPEFEKFRETLVSVVFFCPNKPMIGVFFIFKNYIFTAALQSFIIFNLQCCIPKVSGFDPNQRHKKITGAQFKN